MRMSSRQSIISRNRIFDEVAEGVQDLEAFSFTSSKTCTSCKTYFLIPIGSHNHENSFFFAFFSASFAAFC